MAADSVEKFNRWYRVPLTELQKLPEGNGGFVVLGTSLFLYERYAIATRGAGRETIEKCFALDFGIPAPDAELVWTVLRDGFLHQGMAKIKEHGANLISGWGTAIQYNAVEVDRASNPPFLKFDPFKIKDRVLQLYDASPTAIDASSSFLFATIYPII